MSAFHKNIARESALQPTPPPPPSAACCNIDDVRKLTQNRRFFWFSYLFYNIPVACTLLQDYAHKMHIIIFNLQYVMSIRRKIAREHCKINRVPSSIPSTYIIIYLYILTVIMTIIIKREVYISCS